MPAHPGRLAAHAVRVPRVGFCLGLSFRPRLQGDAVASNRELAPPPASGDFDPLVITHAARTWTEGPEWGPRTWQLLSFDLTYQVMLKALEVAGVSTGELVAPSV